MLNALPKKYSIAEPEETNAGITQVRLGCVDRRVEEPHRSNYIASGYSCRELTLKMQPFGCILF